MKCRGFMVLVILLPLLLIPVAQADDAEKTRAEIKRLEARAEKLLNDGKRKEAFATLAQIAEMRDGLKKKPRAKRAVDAPRPDRVSAQVALDRALASGDLKAARLANDRLKVELRQRAERQKRINQRRAARLAELEKQVQELKKLLRR